MQTTHSGPKALTEYILYQSKHKGEKRPIILLIQGILAGMYISFGAIGYFKVAGAVVDPGLGTFLGALVFPFGIIAILLMHAELFTSDTMVMVAVYDGRTKAHKIIGILVFILAANLLGTLLIALLSNGSGIFSEEMLQLISNKAIHKVQMSTGQMFLSGILCNIIVCTSVCLAYSSKDEWAKVVVLWLGITIFVLSGTEHVVANMYYFFVAYFAGAAIGLGEMFYSIAVVAVANFIGGGIIVSGINYMLAYRDINKFELKQK